MILDLCLSAILYPQSNIKSTLKGQIELAIKGTSLSGKEFHRAIAPFTYAVSGEQTFQRTLGDKGGLMVNVNSPNDDDVNVYRVFIWPERDGNHAQVLQFFTEQAQEDNSFTEGPIYWMGDTLVMAGWRQNWSTPVIPEIAYYRKEGGTWKQIQILDGDPDSDGYASFTKTRQGIDITRLKCTMRLRPPHFFPPELGPWVPFHETWILKDGKYVRGNPEPEKTPLFQLELLAGDAQSGDHKHFDSNVPKPLRKKLWKLLSSKRLMMLDDARPNTNSPDDNTNMLAVEKTVIQFHKVGGIWKPYRLSKYDMG